MSANVDAMVRAGVDAYRAGNKIEARTLLERAIELDSYNETAWLWLSAVVDTTEEKQTCLENVLVINPQNSRARQGLKSLGIDPDTINQPTSTPAFEEGTFDEYAVPSSSASVEYSGPQTSSDEYDNWVDGLNINNTDSGGQQTANQDLFGDVDFSDDGASFNLDDNIFNEDAYSGYTQDTAADSEIDYIDADLYGDDDLFDDGDDMFADIGTLENFTDAVGTGDDYDASEFLGGDPFASPKPKPMFVDAPPEPTTQDYFSRIPKEIQATRAPGVSEAVPTIHYVLIGILAIVNIGALAFVGFQFVG